jgi:hypothetical protein
MAMGAALKAKAGEGVVWVTRRSLSHKTSHIHSNVKMQQKRHRPPQEKTSGLSCDTALYSHKYKKLHENSR